MSNNQTRPFTSKLLQTKLGILVERLQSKSSPTGSNSDFVTQEQLMSEAIKVLSEFYRTLSTPGFQAINPVVDTEPSPSDFNQNFTAIHDDISTVFGEFENMEGVILGNFNYMVSRLNRLSGKLKAVSSLLGDYALLSNYPTKDAIFFGDTFTNMNRVQFNSPLLNSTQLEVNQIEGIVTLPIDRTKQKQLLIKDLPVINSNSNGTNGNTMEAGKAYNGDISVILDGNSDTWFEYERVVSTDDGTPLTLDLTVNLGSPQIINFIRVNPNNFGTKTTIEILAIDTSIDGDTFISIKDDIPIAGWTVQDEENVFVLASTTSKYAGQGLFTFTPRKAKYVHLTLRQSTPYQIKTSSGLSYLRYAIGIRDIHIEAQPYKTKGELISTEYTSGDEVRKVVLLSNQNPYAATTSTLASVKHYVSPDNGTSWYEIRPKISDGVANTTQTVPELLDFNGVDKNTIKTPNPVFKLRYKALLERNPDAFTAGSSDLCTVQADETELHKPPLTTPFSITLQKKPISGTVRLCEPNYGSRGLDKAKYDIATGTGSRLQVNLPWNPVPRTITKSWNNGTNSYDVVESGDETLWVDGKEWSRGNPATANGTATYYSLDFTKGVLTTGDGTAGAAPPMGSLVTMTFGEERIYPSETSPHTAVLDFPTTNDQDEVILDRVEPFQAEEIVLKRGAKIHKLLPVILPSTFAISFSDNTVFNPAGRRTFIDGEVEFSGYGAGYWSVDEENGILYSYSQTSSATDTTVSFYRYPRTKLTNDQWDFSGRDIVIDDDLWKTLEPRRPIDIPTGLKLFGVPDVALVKGTVEFSNTTEFAKELDFIDGRSEFLSYIKTAEQIPNLTAGALISFNLRAPIVSSTDYGVAFSDEELFVTAKGSTGAIASPGDYYVDRTNSRIYLNLSTSTTTPGTITYYYSNPVVSTTGRYSINYKTGQIYTFAATSGSAGTVNYQYTDYRIKYPMAREVPTTDYEVDIQNSKVTVKDREVLNNMKMSQVTSPGGGRDKYYRISYKYMKAPREDVAELEPYFSPVLKDYALKLVTKSRLV